MKNKNSRKYIWINFIYTELEEIETDMEFLFDLDIPKRY